MIKTKKTSKRVDIKVEALPYSIRTFIGEIMNDEAKFNAFAESPITALMKANVPINASKFTKKDAEHLVVVMGKIQAYVKAKKFAKDVRFEEVFNVVAGAAGAVAFVSPESNTYTWRNITPRTFTRTRRDQGISPNFHQDGLKLEQIEDIFAAPLISPAEFTQMLNPLETHVDTQIR